MFETLKTFLSIQTEKSTIGIAHTRWATHGAPSDRNSHPHDNEAGTIAIVHNGIIENYSSLKTILQKRGYKFKSETDTEVLAHLIDDMMKTHDKVYFTSSRKSGVFSSGRYVRYRGSELEMSESTCGCKTW